MIMMYLADQIACLSSFDKEELLYENAAEISSLNRKAGL
jgi:hypothetical protein